MKNSIFLLVVLFLTGTYVGKSQQVTVLKSPATFKYPGRSTRTNKISERIPDKIWRVLSDRSNNYTYTSSELVVKKTSIQFGDLFFVIDETDEAIHIVKDENIESNGELSSKAEDMGWISKEKMLLWEKCLKTQDKIPNKVFAKNTSSSITTVVSQISDSAINFYATPEMTDIRPSTKGKTFEIYFVFKVILVNGEESAYLVGTTESVTGGAGEEFLGWIPASKCCEWNTRISLAPNWDPQAIEERKQKSIPIYTFYTIDDAEAYVNDSKKVDKYLGKELSTIELSAEIPRYPLLSGDYDPLKNNIYKIGSYGRYKAKNSGVEVSREVVDKDKTIIQKKIESQKRLNIVFIIDGTLSMEPFFKEIATSLSEAMPDLAKLNENDFYEYKFGVVVYRDSLDKPNHIETLSLTKNITQVQDFLNKAWDAGKLSAIDKTHYECYYCGFYGALNNIGLNPSEYNVFIVIGDCGHRSIRENTPLGRFQTDIVKKLNEYNPHLFIYQVANRNDNLASPWSQFRVQSKQLMKNYMEKQQEILEKSSNKKFDYGKYKDTVNLITGYRNGPRTMKLRYCNEGGGISHRTIGKLVENDIRETGITQDKNLMILNEAKDFQPSDDVSKSNYAQFELGPLADLANNTGGYVQMFGVSYTPIRIKDLQQPLYKPVIFMTRLELTELRRDLRDILNRCENSNEKREALFIAYAKILGAHIGKKPDEEMENQNISDLMEQAYGLPQKSGLLHSLTLADIKNENKISDEDIAKYIENVTSKYGRINKIYQNKTSQHTNVGKEYFYYIDTEDLP